MYIETSRGSNGRKTGDVARLESAVFPGTKPYCLSFWYHMYGPDVGRLRIRRSWNLNSTIIWTRRGTQGNTLSRAVSSSAKYFIERVVFPLNARVG